jgi:Family of unknown function (DUF5681)
MPDDKDEKVGYGHPPRRAQFRPGKSGNPSGRPKAKRSIRSDLEEELNALTTIEDGETSVEVSKQRAIVKALVKAATAGNLRAVKAVLDFFAKIQDHDDQDFSLEDIEFPEHYSKKHKSNMTEE